MIHNYLAGVDWWNCHSQTALQPVVDGLFLSEHYSGEIAYFTGVEFSLPLAPGSPSESEELASLGDSETEDDAAASNWLQSMGLQLQDHSGATEKIALYPHQAFRHFSVSVRPRSQAYPLWLLVHCIIGGRNGPSHGSPVF